MTVKFGKAKHIPRMKKFRIMGEEFRNRLRRHDVMTKIVSGLVNLRILGIGSVR